MARKFKTPITIDELGSASSQALAANVDGDSQNRINIDAGGKITWGSGSATGDTTLYRSAANTLKTDDTFSAAALAVTGAFTLPAADGTADQILVTDGSGGVTWATNSASGAAAGALTGATLAAGVTASSLTSVGTLSALTVSSTSDVDVTTGHLNVISNTGSPTISLGEWSSGGDHGAIESPSMYILMGGGSINNDTYIRNKGTGSLHLGTNASNDLTIANGGNVGIGTTTPTQTLDVIGSLAVTSTMVTGQASFTQEPWAASTIALGGYGSLGTQGSWNTSLSWNYERGTDSGFYSLGANSYASAGGIDIGNAGIYFRSEGSGYAASAAPAIRMTVLSDGKVGIGTTAPVSNLHVVGSSRASTGFYVGASGDDGIGPVTGSYGSVQTVGSGVGNYEGYSINGRAVFMHNGTTTTGIYDDVNNQWLFYAVHGGASSIRYAGAAKVTTSSTGATVTGTLAVTTVNATTLSASGDVNVGSNGGGDSAVQFYDDNSNTWRTFMWDDSANRFYFEGNLAPSGNIYGPNGSAAAPTYNFSGDTNTGMYRAAADQIGLSTGGAVRVTIKSDGIHLASGDWFRSYGSAGWYSQTYGGGWYMTDTTWVKAYNNKGIQTLGGIAAGLVATASTSGYQYVMRSTAYTVLAYYTSSRKLKESIVDVTPADSGAWMDALQPVMFTEGWLGEGDEPADEKGWREADVQVGFIAEDVLENDIISQFSQANSVDGELKAVGWKWECVIAASVAEIKSLRERLAAAESVIDTIGALDERLKLLEEATP